MSLSDTHDAILLVGFGGPEGPEDVRPFLREVTRGTNVPDARLDEVAGHYLAFGGRSPINDQCRALVAALEAELDRRGDVLPVLWGAKFWHPFTREAVAELVERGARRVLVVGTSAYPSWSGCRSYRETLAAALDVGGGQAVRLDRVGLYGLDDGFVAANAAAVDEALAAVGRDAHVLFVTHSIPVAMNEASGAGDGAYVRWHEEVARRVLDAAQPSAQVDLAFCSRSGPPTQPWLEPDVNDRLAALAAQGVQRVVLAPIGFVSDHMEVVFDLDTEALATARSVGVEAVRAATAGTHPAHVSSLVDRLQWRASQPPDLDVCFGAECCRNLRAPSTPAVP